ncbi:hypothetical protein GQX73_g3623 [Xylaria multiplex]|uniref:Uncharacterized protein n=1 Tax=Xylaria multiplex TaxID=323545 RepID=A0A7C8IZ95_9PEZI|nr:hypothetical protein GQX73_g3623 [Xylaria multiplex]
MHARGVTANRNSIGGLNAYNLLDTEDGGLMEAVEFMAYGLWLLLQWMDPYSPWGLLQYASRLSAAAGDLSLCIISVVGGERGDGWRRPTMTYLGTERHNLNLRLSYG